VITIPSITTILTIVALLCAGAAMVVLPRLKLGDPRRFWMGVGATAVPPFLLFSAFLLDASGRRFLVLVALGLVVATYLGAISGLLLLRSKPGAVSTEGSLALLAAVGTLYAFGSLLQIRLKFQRNPLAGALDGLTRESLREYLISAGLVPLLLITAVLFRYLYVKYATRGKAPWSRLAPVASCVRAWLMKPGVLLVGVPLALIAGFALPILQGGGAAKLSFTPWKIAVSEWLRPLAFLFVAVVLSQHQSILRPGRWSSTLKPLLWFMRKRSGDKTGTDDSSALAPLLSIVGFVVALSLVVLLRSDFGTLLPFGLGLAAMASTLNFRSREAALAEAGHTDSPQAHPLASHRGQAFYAIALVVAALGTLFLTFASDDLMKNRVGPFQNPWKYGWRVEQCQPSASVPAWITPGVDAATGTRYTAQVPAGYALCSETFTDTQTSSYSQMARALTAIDGGGLWGRGLSDSEAGMVPVLDSDFVLAGVWSKFGGVVVGLLAFVTLGIWVLMTRRLSRVPWQLKPGHPANTAMLFSSGMGFAIAGQALYVLSASVNLVPHSGIPFPFVSRGGQAMAALVFGIIIQVVLIGLIPADGQPRIRSPRRSSLGRRIAAASGRSLGIILAVLVTLAALLAGTMAPFHNKQDGNLDSGLASKDVQRALLARGAPPVATIGSSVALIKNRATGVWSVPDGVADQLPLHDLFGVVRVAQGGVGGLVDGVSAPLISAPSKRTTADRLSVPTQTQSRIDLTVSPALQQAVATAARAEQDGTRLPTGAVVLDARNGAILALTSAPDQLDPMAGVASRQEVAAWYGSDDSGKKPRNTGWGEVLGSDGVLRAPAESKCQTSVKCARYRLELTPRKDLDAEYLRTYVGGSTAYKLPNPEENRAAGRAYNLGSTFKIVIAAAWLENGGKINDLIAAPVSVPDGARTIGGSLCRGADPKTELITVADALRVSCNTAFIELAAKQLGWPKVAAMAERLGFTLIGPGRPEPAKTRWPTPSLLPAETGPEPGRESVASLALGGGAISSTPYHMAALMGAIANGGTYHEPYVVASSLDEAGRTTTAQTTGFTVLSAETVKGLRQGLAEVTGEGGTLASVPVPDGVVFYGKSGTQPVRDETPSGNYTSRYFWVVGAAYRKDEPTKPISFAVVVEGHDAQRGHDHVRSVVAELLRAYAGK